MPVGAIVGSAVIGAGGAVVASHNSSKAVSKASKASSDANAANNALTREIYNENKGILSPYVQSGYQANAAINALLGLGGTPQMESGAPTTTPATSLSHPTLAKFPTYGRPIPYEGVNDNALRPQVVSATPAPQPTTDPYQAAFQNYLKSTGHEFRMDEGTKALNASFAARGLGSSGAAAKAALTYGQNIGTQDFTNYLAQLANQQGVGLSAGNALAGVGTNYANTISANNDNNASNIGNAAIANANSNNALIGNIAGITGNAIGQISSYRKPKYNAYGVAGSDGIY